jgi:hypothetical protein
MVCIFFYSFAFNLSVCNGQIFGTIKNTQLKKRKDLFGLRVLETISMTDYLYCFWHSTLSWEPGQRRPMQFMAGYKAEKEEGTRVQLYLTKVHQ